MGAVAVVMGVLVACLAIPFAGLVGVAAKDVSKGMVNLPESLEAKDLSQKNGARDCWQPLGEVLILRVSLSGTALSRSAFFSVSTPS